MEYLKILEDIRWKSKSLQIKSRDKFKCLNCGNTKHLNVHHRQYHYITKISRYKNPWDYPEDILITLCRECHLIGHKKYKIPTIKI
jgi:5-methylcytosine-specific restriction endonuclease McrA